jgi:RNA polymerase sigma-70 factor (ECF subfamily)
MSVRQDARVTSAAEGLERIYREEAPRLWRALVAYSGDPDIASDALAEAFAQALAALDHVRTPTGWIWHVAFRVAAGELKRRRALTALDHSAHPSYSLPEPLDHVMRALASLSPNQRLAVVLHDYADRPTEEVARTMGVSRATVHVHLSQGRRRLRRLLEDNGA